MKTAATLAIALLASAGTGTPATAQEGKGFAILVHGGAGTIRRDQMTAELEAEYRAKLTEAIRAGWQVLERGGASLDAVEATIRILEDSPLFNAGKGAVFTAEGTNELDASIMDGRTLQAGAVAGVTRVRNPISLARLVMERSPHVFMAREGAEAFAREHGVEMVDPSYFWTERRWRSLQQEQERERAARSGTGGAAALAPAHARFGTVGAVALDRAGNLAAGTSTGGMTNKRFGRIGDSPVIGAGTYASNESCAVSATGHGEFFIRNVVAYDVCARVRYLGETVRAAADRIVMQRLVAQQAEGGVIAMDRNGDMAAVFNSAGMYRGWAGPDGAVTVKIYGDE